MYYVDYIDECINNGAFSSNIHTDDRYEQLTNVLCNRINNMNIATIREIIHAMSIILSRKYAKCISSAYCNGILQHNFVVQEYIIVDFNILNILMEASEKDSSRMYIFSHILSIIVMKLMLYMHILQSCHET